MFHEVEVTDIYCKVDDFLKDFKKLVDNHSIGKMPKRKPIMSDSEVMTIMILHQLSDFRTLKSFYLNYVKIHMTSDFPKTVSYNRFVELQKKVIVALAIFAKTSINGKCTGISFIDSTPIRVSNNKRIHNHKVFKGIAQVGKSTMGWFYGFKLHLVTNEIGQIIDFVITTANVDDRDPLKNGNILKNIWGKLYGDKGYISQQLFETLFNLGTFFTTGKRTNMKNQLMDIIDKIMLRKRSIIETINDQLKNICMIEHSRHRSFHNFINNILSGIAAYAFLPKKPNIKFYIDNLNSIPAFF